MLVLSASGEHADVLEAVKAGATGYLVKSAGAEELLAAVRRTADGYPVFTPGLAGLVLGEYRRLADEPPGPARFKALTEAWISYHERDVFPGGCVTTQLSAPAARAGAVATEAPQILGFTSRQTLQHELERRSGGRLHMDSGATR